MILFFIILFLSFISATAVTDNKKDGLRQTFFAAVHLHCKIKNAQQSSLGRRCAADMAGLLAGAPGRCPMIQTPYLPGSLQWRLRCVFTLRADLALTVSSMRRTFTGFPSRISGFPYRLYSCYYGQQLRRLALLYTDFFKMQLFFCPFREMCIVPLRILLLQKKIRRCVPTDFTFSFLPGMRTLPCTLQTVPQTRQTHGVRLLSAH